MALMPDELRLTDEEASILEQIRTAAKCKHEKLRKLAKRLGKSYPDLPSECSWAYEEFFRKKIRTLPREDIQSWVKNILYAVSIKKLER